MPHNSRSYQDLALAARFWWRRVWSIPTYSELAVEDEPLRAELFSADQMALHGKRLAATHILSTDALPEKLLSRLTSNERVLVDLAKQLAATGDGERRLSPAAEWLLDNFYLIEEEVRTARRHLPRGYSRELPRLTLDPINGMGAGLPRVYDLALQVITHSDGQLGRGTLARFIAAYQSVQPLLLGELWAFPIMLRLSLIENLRRVAARVAAAHIDRDSAATWADSMREVAEKSPSDLILVIADMARSMPSLTNAFVAELVRRLQGQGAALALPLTWVEQRLAESQQTIEQLVQLEAQQQAANQVTVSNCIGSLRVLGATDWREFVEGFSSVEQTLRGDPSGIYEQIDFATRDSYRHVVEAIARLGKCSETEVAQQAVALAAAAAEAADGRRAHVGFYLLGTGRIALEQAVSARAPPLLALKRRARSNALLLYAGAIILITLTFTVALTVHAHKQLDWPWWGMLLLALPLSIAVSQLAVSLVNWLATLLVSPRRLPRMDYTSGIPSTARTLVVVPTMLGSATGVQALVDALEVRFLGNRDANLHFGLLTDFHDAAQEHLPSDAALVELAATQIAALNAKYPAASAGGSTFFLFHRPRRWNERERVWMGYERKRGKLADLNQLLRGQDQDSPGKRFARIVGDTRELSHVRYVITLDTDTQLPRESAAQIIATMAHPLNHPRFGTGRKQDIVVEGYGILQPRVGLSLPSINRSGYARLYGGQPGIDPYTRAVSDVYQDLFDEGSFIGKGVYDVDAFERALAGRMPENRILSHDLLEGCYARAGLLSDVQLLEESPARYSDDAARRYRWIRGDWQLTGWLRSRLHMLPGAPVNPLSLLSRAKILDNLRRSLAPSAVLLMLAAGWWLLPEPGLWTLAALAVIALVPIAAHVVEWLRSALESLKTQALTTRGASVRRQTVQALLQLMQTLACLPHEAMYSLSAIARTLWRVLLSKRRLLEWRPSADVVIKTSPGSLPDLLRNVRSLAAGPVLAATCAINLALLRPAALVVAWPVLVLWLLSPLIVWWIDRPLQRKRRALSLTQIQFLRRLARRTWGFFDAHVGPEDHHLPPDNVQEQPVARIAHRTSPTNMGFALLGALVARDFGYLTTGQLLTRLNAALTTMEGMERYRGHFYNWYDTLTLRPLRPHYVSSVDSGNLAGQLLTLRAGLLALGGEPMLARCWREGVSDTFGVLQEALSETLKDARGTLPAALAHFEHLVVHYSSAALRSAQDWRTMLADFDSGAAAILTSISALQTHAAPVKTLPDSATAPLLADDECVQWAHRLAAQCRAGVLELQSLTSSSPEDAWASGMPSLRLLAERDVNARALLQQIEDLAVRAGALAEMEQGFLYDRSRHLMTIGYNVDERRIDAGYYDLLASEMRLGVFVAIAQEQIPQESWFALGRRLTPTAGEPVLLSWSGSMFEYLMPMLVMPTYENTLLDQTCQAAVQRHIEYGARRGLPWGMSESGYNATDTALNYQYRAFGVPGLGLKRGLAEDLVIAPYASMMALMVLPDQACKNLQRLAAEGAAGRYGMYEAIDYTPARLPRGQSKAVVRSFMAHHQGMGLLALAYVLLDRPMQRYFEADARLQATLLLLQERVPHAPVLSPVIDEHAAALSPTSADQTPIRIINDPNITVPEVQLLSNGRYHVMVTQAGGGYSRWKDFAVTRWQEDATRDAWGSFCYLRGVESGELWSTAHQPTNAVGENYEAIFSLGRAEFRRLDNGIETHTEIVVSPEDDIELRRLHITNNSSAQRTIEVTSYAEIVLANPVADGLHPAFSKLFVQTEILQQPAAVLCTRRPRSPQEVLPWMFQLMAVHGVRGQRLNPAKISAISHETDRARFLGRGNSPASPQALGIAGPLSNTAGSVLDPVAASRCTITLEPEQAITVDIVYGVSETRGACVALAEKYQDRRLADRVFELAWTHAQVVLRQLNASESDAQLYGRMASAVIYMQGTLRADASILLRNRRGQSGLWGYAISGDLPIVLLQISSADNIELVRQLVQAHAWWRLKGLAVDLVIWNEERDIYRQQLQEQIMGLIVAGVEAHVIDRPGGIFVRHVEQIAHEDRILLQSVARAVFSDNRGSLAEQVKRRPRRERPVPTFAASRLAPPPPIAARATNNIEAELKLYNGIGGFSADGREYVIAPPAGKRPPAPWSNVIANPRFGSVISEAGSSYTWCENAHELRLTPWHNDPVSDGGGEAIYLRDEETGEVWSPTSLPGSINNDIDGQFITRHGFGYSVFEHSIGGIHAQLKVFVALDAAVKFSVLRLRNDSGRPRTLTATGYVEWVLGDMRAKSAPHIVTEVAPDGVALYARNPYSNDYADWIGFFDADEAQREASSFTCDRTEFIGRNGSMRDPAALHRAKLSGRVGVALDPCAAIQVPIDLLDGQSGEITFRLGMGRSADEAGKLLQRFRGRVATESALDAVQQHWQRVLGAVQVRTPDPTLDMLANGWLLYQTVACRIWARSGYYQSGGAFGFRDQLQDAMALVHCEPQILREQLLRCASRQFVAGDVQHWWHPPQGRGVRTRISDDYLWLPLALARYVETTGDTGVLDESVPFLEGREVNPLDDSYYDLPLISVESASLYEHAVRALKRGLRFGAHGLPLMGTGDWNDGMNLVGHHGKGESIWLGFFLCEVLLRFGELARQRGDETVAQRCTVEHAQLKERLEANGWDGAWYRRAYFDDGTPLGSSANAECRIDSIAQSWGVLSGAAQPARARTAMDAVLKHLVRPENHLVQLLDPPFNQQGPNPGYIAGYVPGVRENGGQYTHGAIWAAMAFAALGRPEDAWAVFDIINPVRHALTPEDVARYKVEPYVVAADVYSVAPHIGRGGWSWYTGSAGWMYRLIVESLLGLRLETSGDGARLRLAPCLPADWPGYSMQYCYRETIYNIEVLQSGKGAAPTGVWLDDVPQADACIPLLDDGKAHRVRVTLHG